jgi:hypothetical protein
MLLVTQEALEGFPDFIIGGQGIRILRYVNDLALLATKGTVLEVVNDRPIEIRRKYGMDMNLEKTKVMKISRQPYPVQIMVDKKQMGIQLFW